jgi:alginate O-acetyltransferase complex protein AlgI
VAEWRTDFNLFITMAIGGLWHGANFTFIVWGVYHGLLLIVERRIGEARLALVNNGLRHGITLLLVAVGWTIFRSANLEQALAVLRGMTGLNGLTAQFNSLLIEKNLLSTCLTVFGLVFLIFGEKRLIREQPLAQQDFPVRGQWVIWGIFLAALLMNASNSEIPFLYFQF